MSPKLLNILLILISGVLYFFVTKPLYTGADSGVWLPENNIQALRTSTLNYEETLKGADALLSKAKIIQKQYDSYDAATKNKMMVMIPDSINDIKMLNELTKLQENTLPLENLSVRDKGSGEYEVSFSVLATYTKFKEFINQNFVQK